MAGNGGSLASLLEADLRALSAESRKQEPGFAGYFGGASHPEIKEAAERALLKMRSLPQQGQMPMSKTLATVDELSAVFLMACETKVSRLVILGLGSLQKLVANEAIAPEPIPKLIQFLKLHADVFEEAVQLKTLQMVLTILQSPLVPEDEEGIAQLLHVCFRLLANARCADSVHTTAAATLRQAVALIFERITTTEGLMAQSTLKAAEAALELKFQPGSSTKAGLLLFNDLCALAAGEKAPWLAVPALPRAFALDMLEFVLANHPIVFRKLPNFERLLGGRLASLLLTSLRAERSVEDEAGEMVERRLLMRTVVTVVRNFAQILSTECEIYLTVLIKSLEQDFPLWHRIFVLEVLRTLCGDGALLRFLWDNYDGLGTTKVVRDLAVVLARHVHSAMQLGEGMQEILYYMSQLFTHKAQGIEWSPDMDLLLTGGIQQEAYAVALATDGLLSMIRALSDLTVAASPSVGTAPPKSRVPTREQLMAEMPTTVRAAMEAAEGELSQVEAEAAAAAMREAELGDTLEMVEATAVRRTIAAICNAIWEILLMPMAMLLAHARGEALVSDLLKGYQAFTETAGVVGEVDVCDKWLASLCDFTLAQSQPTRPLLPDARRFGHGADQYAQGGGGMNGDGRFALEPAGSSGSGWSDDMMMAASQSPVRVGGESEGGLLLSPKNVHALRTLFEIAHRLASTLGKSWALVLETLSHLERALQSPHTTTADGQRAAPGGQGPHGGPLPSNGMPSDLAILAAAATRLFESTVQLDDAALDHLLQALVAVSGQQAKALPPNAPLVAGHPGARLFALQRLVDVVLYNPQRLARLWPQLQSHVMDECMGHGSPAVRGAAMEALDRAVSGAVAAAQRLTLEPGMTPLELTVLMPVEALLRSPHEDARLGAVRIVCHLLQRVGDRLTVGWRAVVAMLVSVAAPPQDGYEVSAVLVGQAFQSVQFIAQDYLGTVPEGVLVECVRMTAAYAAQPVDMNTSLTAIGLLWNMADFFGRTITGLLRASDGNTAEGGGDPSGSAVGAAAARAATGGEKKAALIAEVLLLPLFTSLQKLCSDPRPEVRNSGLRTLLSTMVSHGAKLPAHLWRTCLWEILFPLLDTVRQLAAASSREESVGTQLGQDKGRAVMMLVHHSRNTEQKQWDETLVLSLNGMGRLLRSYLPVLSSLEGFDVRWDSFLAFFESSVVDGNREVAVAAIGSLTAILQGHAGTAALPRPLWKRAMKAYGAAVRGASQMASKVTIKTRAELISALARLYAARRSAFDEADLRSLLALLDGLCRAPFNDGEAAAAAAQANAGLGAAGLPPVQRAVLEFLPQWGPLDDRHVRAGLWSATFQMLLAYLPGEPPGPAPEGAESRWLAQSPVTGDKVETIRGALSAAFAERVIPSLVSLYKDHAPTDARSQLFPHVVSALGACVATRGVAPEAPLWRTAAAALVAVVRAGLPAVNMTSSGAARAALQQRHEMLDSLGLGATFGQPGGKGGPHPDDGWVALCDAFDRLLLPGAAVHQAASGAQLSAEQRRADDELEVAGLDALCDVVLCQCASAPDHLRRRLVRIVDCGMDRPIPRDLATDHGGERFAHVCLRKLFVLCARGGETEGPHACTLVIARHALPVLIGRCEAIIGSYVADDAADTVSDGRGGRVSLPRHRLEEMLCVLEVLETMTLDPRVSNWLAEGNDDFPGHPGIAGILAARRKADGYDQSRERTHLMFLFPALCAAVGVRDARLRDYVQRLLLLCGHALALVPTLPGGAGDGGVVVAQSALPVGRTEAEAGDVGGAGERMLGLADAPSQAVMPPELSSLSLDF